MTPVEKLERAKQLRIDADAAWERGSKELSESMHHEAARLKAEALAEEPFRDVSPILVRGTPGPSEPWRVAELPYAQPPLSHAEALNRVAELERELASIRRSQAEEAAHRMMHPRVSSANITRSNTELADAINTWRKLTEEQRNRFDESDDMLFPDPDVAALAKRLLKAAAR